MTDRNVTSGLQGSGVKRPSDVEVRKVGAAELRESCGPKNEDKLSFRGHKAVSSALITFSFFYFLLNVALILFPSIFYFFRIYFCYFV